jgi:hypothetical protein
MADNQLARYSKVLEANIGNVYTAGPPPACLEHRPLAARPSNTSHPESLASGQKLLSLGQEVELPVRGQEAGGLLSDGLEVDWLGSTDNFSSSPALSWSLVYLFSGLVLGSYFTYRYCSNKYNYRLRRRPNRLARLISAVDF